MHLRLGVLACLGGFAATAPAKIDDELPPVPIPSLPSRAPDAAGFVPPGWGLEATAKGDLNGDGAPDLALVLKAKDPSAVIPNESGLCGEELDTNPRILAAALAEGGAYRLAAYDSEIISRRDNPCAVDHFSAEESLEVSRGVLTLSLERFMSAGGWSMSRTGFTFRWQQDALRLIGYDFSNVQRNTGEMSTLSINYLTGRVKTTTGNIAEDSDRVRWTRLHARRLLAMEEVGDGLTFDPEDLVSNLP